MAERVIPWNFYINNITNGPRTWPNISYPSVDLKQAGEKLVTKTKDIWNHPFATKIRGFAVNSVANWWENVNPLRIGQKDTAWKIGAALGAIESIAVIAAIPLIASNNPDLYNYIHDSSILTWLVLTSGFHRTIRNLGVSQLAYLASKGIHNTEKLYLNRIYQGADKAQKLTDLENRRAGVDTVIKSAFKGLAAGSIYGAVPANIANIFTHMIGEPILHINNPNPINPPSSASAEPISHINHLNPQTDHMENTTQTAHLASTKPTLSQPEAQPSPKATPTAATSPTPEAKPTPGPSTTPESVLKLTPDQITKANLIENDTIFKQTLAAEAGLHINTVDEAVRAALKADGLTPSDLTPTQLHHIRESVQHSLEAKINEAGHLTAQEMIHDRPDINIHNGSVQDLARRKIEIHLSDWLADSKSQEALRNVASQAIHNQGIHGTIPTAPVEPHSYIHHQNPQTDHMESARQVSQPAPSQPAVTQPGTAPATQPIEGVPTGKPSNVIDLEKVRQFVEQNKDNPSLVQDHTVAYGETAGQDIVDMGGHISWDGTDALELVAYAEANPNMFFDLHTGLPLTPGLLHDLAKQLQDPNPVIRLKAYRELIKYMGGMRAGSHAKWLSKTALSTISALKAA